MNKKMILLVSILALLGGCSGLAFTYTFYGLDSVDYNGTLIAQKGKTNLPLSDCTPDPGNKGKCVVVFADEFYRLKADYQSLEQQLSDCQAGK